MKYATTLAVFLTLYGCQAPVDHTNTVNTFINYRECGEAEAYAYKNFRGDYLHWTLGNIEINCKKNRKAAIEYYRAGARNNSEFSNLSVNALIRLGETPPEPTRQVIIQQQQQRPQQIIIQQPQQQQQEPMGTKMNSCMQDGGSLYCPNHPNTRR